jgi:four helix bundle protein
VRTICSVKLHQLSFKAFPTIERFELGSQLRRSAFSVAVNIVEGFARPAGKARLNFLNISQSSLAEVGYCVHVARRLGYLSETSANDLETEIKSNRSVRHWLASCDQNGCSQL